MKALRMGNLSLSVPIIQGGMGVGISLSGLASAVANEGGAGVISSAGLGLLYRDFSKDFLEASIYGLKEEIRKARQKTLGVIGVNVMVAMTNFSDMIKTAISEKVDLITAGAGLPLDLPSFLKKDSITKLVPIVSSARAARIICEKWKANYDYLPDAVIVEGPKAGGHLGFKEEQIADRDYSLEKLVPEIVKELKVFEDKYNTNIPLIAAGGIYTGGDIMKIMDLGASGVQMGTRFAKEIESKITPATKAVIPVHLYGQSAEMDEINAIAKKHGIKVIEDGAQAIGVQYKDGRKVGTLGDIGCFSFFPSKNLGCFGDGGLVTTNDDALGEKLRIMRVHGGKPKYYHKIIGGNFRLDAIQAGVLSVKLPHLDSWSEKRRQNAELYTKLFIGAGLAGAEGKTELSGSEKVLLPKAVYKESGHKNYHIYNQYVIRVEKRDELRKYLTEKEIGTEIYYPVPFHKQECFAELKSRFGNTDFAVSEFAAGHSIALPIYPELTNEQIEYVVKCIAEFIK